MKKLFTNFLNNGTVSKNAVKVFLFSLLLCGISVNSMAAIAVTPASGGTNICSNTAADGSAPAYTPLGDIIISEGLIDDLGLPFGMAPWNVNITINAPAGWSFNTAATVTFPFTAGADITGITQTGFTATTLTLRITVAAKLNLDAITLSGLEVRPNNTYSASGNVTGGTFGGATGYDNSVLANLSVSPLPISGTRGVCVGGATNLSDATPGGTWGSSNTALATVTVGGGVVSGVAIGTVIIDYTVAGCVTTYSMTVNNPPGSISGNLVACANSTSTLSNTVAGGVWSSATTTVATITTNGGVVSALTTVTVTATSVISYTIAGCAAAQATFTVNPRPASISGTTTTCIGQTTTISSSPVGGTWSSTNTAVATIAPAGFVVSGVTGGTSAITYILPTGCLRTTNVTVNTPPTISGASTVCSGQNTQLSSGTPNAGVWTSATTAVATVTNGGLVNGVPTVTVPSTSVITFSVTACPASLRSFTVNPTPANISGNRTLCVNTTIQLSSTTAGGVWTSTNTGQATVSGGLVTAVSAGNPVISYTIGSCSAQRTLSVNPIPNVITGTTVVCTGNTTRLSSSSPGGTWSSTNTGVATIAPTGNGTVFGVAAGTTDIHYTFASGCERVTTVTVNQSPAPITGSPLNACEGLTINLSDVTAGGTWSSSNTAVATIDAFGEVSGVSPGTSVIRYHDGTNACTATTTVTINATPSTISGATLVCEASSTPLSNTSPGGNWSSSNSAIATVNAVTGVVTGVSGGTVNITYDFGAACTAVHTMSVDPLPVISAVIGSTQVCLGGTTQLSDATPTGVWSSNNTALATVSVSGLVSGVAVGTVDILYTVTNSCGSQFATHTMNVDNITPDVSITTSVPGLTSCEGVAVTYTANPVSGGSSPVYEWRVNGTIASVAGTLIYTPVNGDEVIVQITSNAACLAVATGADTVTLIVDPNLVPSVHITSSTYGDTVCVGTSTPFTAVPVNGGTAPAYSWLVNGAPITGGNPFNHIPANGDVVTVEMTSSYQCAVPATVVSNSVTMTVDVTQTPTISITASANPSCEGTPVTFTAQTLYGGLSPFIRWSQNGINVATGPMYTIIPANGDQFYAVLKSSSVCRTADSVFSNTIIEQVDTAIVPVTTIVTNHTTITVGQKDTLIAVVTPAGLSPTFQWYLNGVVIPGATLGYYVVTGTAPGVSYYYCIVGNGNACNTTNVSNLITINTFSTGVDDVSAGSFDLKLVPNPNGGTFSVEGAVPANSGAITLEVTNMIGQVVYKQSAQVQNDKMSQQVSLGNELANGVYMLHVITDNEHKIIRFSLSR